MKTRLATFFLTLATLCGLQAQTPAADALYVYRTDGRFTVFTAAEVDSITYSRYDADYQLHPDWQMQLVHTAQGVSRIPLSVIDSVSFVAPKAGNAGIDYAEQPAADVVGAGTVAEPYEVSGDAPLSVELQAVCHYTDSYGHQYAAAPKATVSLAAKYATDYAEDLETLTTLIQTADPTTSHSGDNPVVYFYKGSFATAGQVFDFETSYEVYKTENGAEMPYLKFGEPRLISVEVKERATTRAVSDTVHYDITAKFEVGIEGVNITEKLNETMSFEVDYTGGVVASKDVPLELIKTEYRKDMIFYEGHDNLNMGAQAVVYRDNYYSDGSIQVDTLRENGAMALFTHGISDIPKGTKVVDDGDGYSGTYAIEFADGITMRYKRHETYWSNDTEFVYKYVSSVEVPDFDNLRSIRSGGLDWTDGFWGQVGPTDDLSEYKIFGVDTYYDASNPQDGVYYYSVDNDFQNKLRYRYNNKNYDLVSSRFAVIWYDRIASIDGELITFEEFRPTLKDVKDFKSYEEVEATSTRGPARVYTAEVTGTYLGVNVHLISIDTVYVMKQDPIAMLDVTVNPASDITACSAKLSCKLAEGQKAALDDVRFIVYGGTYNKAIACIKPTELTEEDEYVVTTDVVFANATFSYNVAVTGKDGCTYWGQTQNFTTPDHYTEDDAVDLGLSVKWSSCQNVGANYDSPYIGSSWYPLTYTVTESEWSDGWRLPTQAEWQELCDKCSWELSDKYNGLLARGYIITGPNGNSIYLPVFDVNYYLIASPNGGKTFLINKYYKYSFVNSENNGNVRLVRDK